MRLKCRYGCNAYGKHLSCPPYSPTPEETEKILSDYEDAVLVEFVGLPKETTVDPRHIHHHLKDLILHAATRSGTIRSESTRGHTLVRHTIHKPT